MDNQDAIDALREQLDEINAAIAAHVAAGDTAHLGGLHWAAGQLALELRELEG